MFRHNHFIPACMGIIFSCASSIALATPLLSKMGTYPIHTVVFHVLVEPTLVRAAAYVGQIEKDKQCHLSQWAPLGVEYVQNGQVDYIDGDQLKTIFGGGYTCMHMEYEDVAGTTGSTFNLIWDKENKAYTGSDPQTDRIQIY